MLLSTNAHDQVLSKSYSKTWLLGTPCYYLHICILFMILFIMHPSWYTASFIRCMCIKQSTRWRWEIERNPWYQEHTAHLMVIRKSNMRRAIQVIPILANTKLQATSFATYETSSKISLVLDALNSAYFLKYKMAASEEDGVFWFYVNTRQVNASKDLLHHRSTVYKYSHACLQGSISTLI